MKRWLLWFLLAPQGHLLAGLWRDAGLPAFDMAVVWCLFLAFHAERAAVPWLLLGAALSRSLVDAAALPVQMLVLGVPVAVLLPLRPVVHGQNVLWQATAATVGAIAVPKLAGLFGRWFEQPSAGAALELGTVAWTALLVPPLLWLLRGLPPCRAFVEVR